MMRQFLTFTRKEFYHIFRDRWTMIMLLAFPIIMIILFGFGITTEIKNSKVAIYDPSRDLATQHIAARLGTSEYFTIAQYLERPAEIETIFKEGKVGLLVVFSENFYQNIMHTGEAGVLLIADGTDPNTASTLTTYATRIIMMYQQELLGIENLPFTIHTEVKLLYNPTLKSAYNIVPGVMGMVLILICTDDFGFNCQRKRAGNHGSNPCIAHASAAHRVVKSGSVLCDLAHQFYQCADHCRFPVGRTREWQPIFTLFCLHYLHFRFTCPGSVDLFSHRQAAGGFAHVSHGPNDARSDALRTYVPY